MPTHVVAPADTGQVVVLEGIGYRVCDRVEQWG